MLLIDSLYVNSGGGLVLLKYLVSRLEQRDIDFFLLTDVRANEHFKNIKNKAVLKASLKNRYFFYKQHVNEFSVVFCFGNIPPIQKLNVPVYTYFQNVVLIDISKKYPMKMKMLNVLKRTVLYLLRNHTDEWFVQTENTEHILKSYLGSTRTDIKKYPFFKISEGLKYKNQSNDTQRNDYVFVGDYYYGAKGHDNLLKAWGILYERGQKLRLHLTVDKRNVDFDNKIVQAGKKGLLIVNHGNIPFNDVVDLYYKSKATIYPSFNESLGLGIVEAIEAGCDIIASDLPFTHSICQPSETFDPYSPMSIVEAVERYEKGNSEKSQILIKDRLDEMIDYICKKK